MLAGGSARYGRSVGVLGFIAACFSVCEINDSLVSSWAAVVVFREGSSRREAEESSVLLG